MAALMLFAGCQSGGQEELAQNDLRLVKMWETDSVLTTSESVLFDEEEGIFFVSCIGNVPPSAKDGDGFIAKVAYYGNIVEEKWVTGLDAPKGMGTIGDTLFVADIDQIIMINKTSGQILDTIRVPESEFLNDITVDQTGSLYISDSEANKIFKLTEGEVEVWLEDAEMGGPNGLYAEANRIMVATFAKGNFNTIDIKDQKMTARTDSLPSGDGVVKIDDGYLVSNWNGEVYHVNEEWEKTKILDTKDLEVNAADIEVVPEHSILLVPTFFGNSVAAYEINRLDEELVL